jgi:hypothetical protein
MINAVYGEISAGSQNRTELINTKCTLCWVVMPCRFVEIYTYFGMNVPAQRHSRTVSQAANKKQASRTNCLRPANGLHAVLVSSQDGGSADFRNIAKFLLEYMASYRLRWVRHNHCSENRKSP